jgi:hypothetical protein
MNRGASSDVQAEWAKSANEPAHLVELRFDTGDGGTIYLTDSYRSVVWNGHTYLANGDPLGFSGLQESAEMRVAEVMVQLSAVDQTMLAIFAAANWIDRRILIYKMFFDQSNEALMVDPVAIHDGRMDEPALAEDPDSGTSVLTVTSRDQFSDFDRLSGRHTNSVEQKLFFPSDTGFDLVTQIAGKQASLQWGAATP